MSLRLVYSPEYGRMVAAGSKDDPTIPSRRTPSKVPVPMADRSDSEWIVVTGGPSSDLWMDAARERRASIVAVNEAAAMVSDPDIFLASDKDAISKVEKFVPDMVEAGTDVRVGWEDVVFDLPQMDVSTLSDHKKRIRTIGIHGVRHALGRGAARVLLCGLDGWPSDQMDYTRVNGRRASRAGSNENMAECLGILKKMYPMAVIEFASPGVLSKMMGGGYNPAPSPPAPKVERVPKARPVAIEPPQTPGTAVILIGGGPSLNAMLDDVIKSPLPRFCVNNSVKLVTNPDFWYGNDIKVPHVFPTWLWAHGCRKFCPDPSKRVARFISPANRRAVEATVNGARNLKQLDIRYRYDKGSFLDGPVQVGFPWADKEGLPGIPRTTTSSMPPALRLCADLGFKDIYLVGVDLSTPGEGFYAYDPSRVNSARLVKEEARMAFCHLVLADQVPLLKGRGIRVWNCNPDGGAADVVPYGDFRL